MSWLYKLLSVRAFSDLPGILEIGTAVLIALRPLSAKAAIAGSGIAVVTFLTTLPGWESSLGGFRALAVVPGQVLSKDGCPTWSIAVVPGGSAEEISCGREEQGLDRNGH
ncbi:MAG: hypothetical protein ACREAC_00590 [Blastocatellia bacterium]